MNKPDISEFLWTERQGRFEDDSPFHEWVFQHASGRVLAAVQGPTDKRGGFTHNTVFLFAQEITMRGGPFMYLDFDSAKRFSESVVMTKLLSITPEGDIEVSRPPDPFQETMKGTMAEAMKAAAELIAAKGRELSPLNVEPE